MAAAAHLPPDSNFINYALRVQLHGCVISAHPPSAPVSARAPFWVGGAVESARARSQKARPKGLIVVSNSTFMFIPHRHRAIKAVLLTFVSIFGRKCMDL